MPERPLLVGVGGFLGAGKTTAIVGAAARLRAAGRRVAVITNDQAGGLVDTAVVRQVAELRCFAPARPVPTYRLQPAAHP